MKITKGDKTIIIPGWALVVSALVVDNIVTNICKAKSFHDGCKAVVNTEKEKES